MTRILIAEDEEELRVDLEKRLKKLWPDAQLVASVSDGAAALEALDTHAPEVAFLDVRMPELSGLEVARAASGRCQVVFVTAYDDAAVAAFESGAVDYLLKPLRDERLASAIARVRERLKSPAADLSQMLARLTAPTEPLRWVQASNGRAIEFVPVDEVVFFRAEDKYTTVRTVERELLIRTSLKELLPQLDSNRFWQIHRSTIVNVDFIERVLRDEAGDLDVRLRGLSDVLPVSRSFRYRFKYM